MKTSSHARSTSTIKQKPFQQELVKLDEGYQSLNSLKGLSKTDESPIAILDEDIAIREVDEFEPEGNLQYWHDFKKSLLDVDEEIETIEPRPEKIVPKRIDIIKQKRELYIPPFVKREKEVNKFRRFLSDIGLVKKHSTPMMDINEDCEDDHVDEIINISDKAPNFSSTPYTAIAEVNKKLFESKYFELSKQVGAGGHSSVKLGRRISTVQAKSVWNWYFDATTGRKIPLEIHIMKKFNNWNHPSIIRYLDHFEMASGNYIIVMEYLGSEWIDLYDYIEMHGPVREDYAKEIFKQVVETVEFLHEKGYSHNDIKDENILINPETRELKLIDFGSTTLFHPKQAHTLFYGTKKFAAPESLENTEYLAGPQEAWCLGTLLYVLLFKMDPFKDDVEIINLDISRRIERLREAGHAYGGASISQAAVELMVGLMNKNPVKRIDCLEIKESTWFS